MDDEPGNGLSPTQNQLIAALLEEPTQGRACEKLGLHLNTASRWMRDPRFRAALRDAERGLLEEVTRRCAGLAHEALNVLAGIMGDEEQGGHVRVRAALGVMDAYIKLTEHLELEQRVATLEASVLIRQELLGD